MSGTTHQNMSHSTSILNLTDSLPHPAPPTLRRVNTPPNLHLSSLMSGDTSVLIASNKHRRSYSAIGGRPADMGMQLNSAAGYITRPATSASAMSALQMDGEFIRSPCFVHKTFGDSLNIERVMEECRAEEMTHHNLQQTATGVREVARQLGIYYRNIEADVRTHCCENKNQKCDDCNKGS